MRKLILCILILSITYAQNVVDNAKAMGDEFLELGYDLVSGGTDTHVLLIDLSKKGINGRHAENILGKAGIALNKNMVPFDNKSPFITSGIRIGTPAITTRGMGKVEMKKIVNWINQVILEPEDEKLFSEIRLEVNNLCSKFPIYSH